jgi:hypothetical protein
MGEEEAKDQEMKYAEAYKVMLLKKDEEIEEVEEKSRHFQITRTLRKVPIKRPGARSMRRQRSA